MRTPNIEHRASKKPSIEDYATIEAQANGYPVYAFGYTFVYSVSPDLLPGVAIQQGNLNPITKLQPKKSWEIQHNLCGSTPAREPKTAWNDDQPLLPIHLIDGDPETAWCSRGGAAPNRQPEWIRIDLPIEAEISSVALVCCDEGPLKEPDPRKREAFPNIGKALPGDLTVKLSRNAADWETVYENAEFSGPNVGPTVVEFEPRRAKQILVGATNLPTRVGNWGYCLSIGAVEVRNTAGENLALISRGAGAQVSSTFYGYGMDRFTQDMLWPIQYDLGFKWTRVGYDMGVYLWNYVEREKGKLEIDAKADQAVTDAVNCGMKVILVLDKGNWLYHDPPRKVDWKKARTSEMMETYFDHQGWPGRSPEMLAGFLKYVDYMVRHFKGRVEYFEMCNEWWEWEGIFEYIKVAEAMLKTIRQADQDSKIILGSISGFNRTALLACLGDRCKLAAEDGKLVFEDMGNLIVKDLKIKDAHVSVKTRSHDSTGIVLRFQDRDNFVVAVHGATGHSTFPIKHAYFRVVQDGWWSPQLAWASCQGLGEEITLDVRIEGLTADFTVSDGEKTVKTSLQLTDDTKAGSVGLYSDGNQVFKDFRAEDLNGKVLFEDSFQAPSSPPEGWEFHPFVKTEVGRSLAKQINGIGFHPWYQADPDSPAYRSYKKDFTDFKNRCKELGFDGVFAATEWTWAAPYPGDTTCTEMTKAKYSARLMTEQCGLGIISLYNETFQTGRIDWDCNLLRNAFSVDPISPAQPQPIYYVFRTISTVLDGFLPADFTVEITGPDDVLSYTFRRDSGNELVAAWIPGKTVDGVVEKSANLRLPGKKATKAWVTDVFNGTQQELTLSTDRDGTLIEGLMIRDYPVFVRLEG